MFLTKSVNPYIIPMVFPEDFYLAGFMAQSEAIEKQNNFYT
jgi:hypothetical protein